MILQSTIAPSPATPPPQPTGSADPSNTGLNTPADSRGTGQSQDTAPPAPVSSNSDSARAVRTGGDTDSYAARYAPAPTGDASSTRSAVEAKIIEPGNDNAHNAAQSKDRLDALLAAVQPLPSTTQLSAPTAAQASAGPAETDGTPV